MRVLHVDAGKEMRGGQWQALYLVERLGSGATLLAAEGGPLLDAARRRGITAAPLTIANLAALSRRAELTHVHDARSHSWAAALAGTPVVVSRRVAFPVGQSPLSRWKYLRARHYIAVSEHVKSTLREAGVGEERISVVYDGVPVPGWQARGDRIVSLATDDAMKGETLVREAARRLGTEIHFSRDLARDLESAAVFVYLTHAEGLGSAALLAMAAGVPVVASRVGGLTEIVRDGETGVLTENEPAAVAAAIAQALSARDRLAAQARAHVERSFSVERMVDHTKRIYKRVLAC
ncbi:MAG: glycosyltransferase family 4 protein [Acidobacteria bacterium]|nr:glycosyltransferase family 4 protein [Acidobacteriota bacterium]MBI3278226.1 glycosyltransferase family 4 protein [Acidobacteriota bacterium]